MSRPEASADAGGASHSVSRERRWHGRSSVPRVRRTRACFQAAGAAIDGRIERETTEVGAGQGGRAGPGASVRGNFTYLPHGCAGDQGCDRGGRDVGCDPRSLWELTRRRVPVVCGGAGRRDPHRVAERVPSRLVVSGLRGAPAPLSAAAGRAVPGATRRGGPAVASRRARSGSG